MQLELLNKIEITKELLTNEKRFGELLTQIDDLANLTFDFSNKETVKEAKNLKTDANKFVKQLKEFCEPLEAEGKKISDARSAITTRLISGKSNVIDKILKPVNEAEDKLRIIKTKINTPIQDLHSVAMILNECEEFEKFNWLFLAEDAQQAIKQLKGNALVAKQTLEAEQKAKLEAEEKARIERDAKIAEEAAEKERKKVADEIRLAEEAKKNAEKRAEEAERLKKEREDQEEENNKKLVEEAAKKERERIENEKKAEEEATAKREADRSHKVKINHEILEDFKNAGVDENAAKNLIIAIAKGEVRHVSIKY